MSHIRKIRNIRLKKQVVIWKELGIAVSLRTNSVLTRPRATCGTLLNNENKLRTHVIIFGQARCGTFTLLPSAAQVFLDAPVQSFASNKSRNIFGFTACEARKKHSFSFDVKIFFKIQEKKIWIPAFFNTNFIHLPPY